MNFHGTDLPHVVETRERPRFTTVSRLVHATSGGDVATQAIRACAVVDDVGVGVSNSNRAARSHRYLPIRDRLPALTAVGSPPQTARSDTHIEGPRLGWYASYRGYTPTLEWTHLSVSHPLEEGWVNFTHHRRALREHGCWRAQKDQCRQGRSNSLVHISPLQKDGR